LLTKARILLKADASETGEGWSNTAISEELDTSIDNIGRIRRRLVEEGLEGALKRKYSPNSPRPRIFDGATKAKLIALICSSAPEGFARHGYMLPRFDTSERKDRFRAKFPAPAPNANQFPARAK
jgi:hypothetical protein